MAAPSSMLYIKATLAAAALVYGSLEFAAANGTSTLQEPIIYCRDGSWLGGASRRLEAQDCRNALNALSDEDIREWGDETLEFLPLSSQLARPYYHAVYTPVVRGSRCKLVIAHREILEYIDGQVERAQPVGLERVDYASYRDLGRSATNIFEQCVENQNGAAGWAIGGQRSSLGAFYLDHRSVVYHSIIFRQDGDRQGNVSVA